MRAQRIPRASIASMSFRVLYAKVSAFMLGKRHQLFVDVTLLASSSYLTLKKSFDWTLTGLLLPAFTVAMVDRIIWCLLILCLYAMVAKIWLLVFNAFPATRVRSNEIKQFARCCMTINEEIATHLGRIRGANGSITHSFLDNHNFARNVLQVCESIAAHLVATLDGARAKDVFVSVYQVPNFEDLDAPRQSLTYICHGPDARDVIQSRTIAFNGQIHSQYECVKCIGSNRDTSVLLDTATYYKSNVKRHGKIKHYIGMKVRSDDKLLGFVNIEFYNTTFFSSEEEMRTFVEENLLSFRSLLEYQFLKRAFFHRVQPHLK